MQKKLKEDEKRQTCVDFEDSKRNNGNCSSNSLTVKSKSLKTFEEKSQEKKMAGDFQELHKGQNDGAWVRVDRASVTYEKTWQEFIKQTREKGRQAPESADLSLSQGTVMASCSLWSVYIDLSEQKTYQNEIRKKRISTRTKLRQNSILTKSERFLFVDDDDDVQWFNVHLKMTRSQLSLAHSTKIKTGMPEKNEK